MRGLGPVLDAAERARREGRPVVLATVVEVRGSSYRRPGARMLFYGDGSSVGFVSGGCLESDLAERAAQVLATGHPRTMVYDMRSPDDVVWGLGLGCAGEIRVLLERLDVDAWPVYLDELAACRRGREPTVLATVFEASGDPSIAVGQRLGVRGAADAGAARVFLHLHADVEAVRSSGRSTVRRYEAGAARAAVLIEHLAPRIRLVVVGAGSDACPLVRFAAGLGWEVVVLDHRPAYATRQRFPDAHEVRCIEHERLVEQGPDLDPHTAVLIMTHHFLHDVDLLARLLPEGGLPYLGVIGPRKRLDHLLEQVRARGVEPTEERLRRLHGPVGVDIGSETAEEIALSVLAEIQAVLCGRAAGFLRDRPGPLHDGPG